MWRSVRSAPLPPQRAPGTWHVLTACSFFSYASQHANGSNGPCGGRVGAEPPAHSRTLNRRPGTLQRCAGKTVDDWTGVCSGSHAPHPPPPLTTLWVPK